MSIEVDKRRSISAELKPYCRFAKDHQYMEVTEWINGEGFDITIDRSNGQQKFSLYNGEWQLLQVLMNYQDSE